MKACILYIYLKKHIILFFTIVFFTQILQAQSEPNVLWTKQFGGTGYDYGISVVTDNSNNIYITGRFSNTAHFDDLTLTTNAGNSIPFVAKTDPLGTLLWAEKFEGNGMGRRITTDGSGNIYTIGDFQGTITFGNITFNGNEQRNSVFVVKQNPTGQVLWANKFASVDGMDNVYSNEIATDTENNVYTAGRFYNTFDFGNTTFTRHPNVSFNAFLTKQDQEGNILWAKKIGETGEVTIKKIITDDLNNLYIAGSFKGTIDLGNNITLYTPNSGSAFFMKMDNSGEVLWAKHLGEESNSYSVAQSICFDTEGNIYVTGVFFGTLKLGTFAITNNGMGIPFVLKTNNIGEPMWIKGFQTQYPTFGCGGNDILSDIVGNIYVVGTFSGMINFGNGISFYFAGDIDAFVLKMDSSGTTKWAKRLGGSGFDDFYGITIDTEQNMCVIGAFEDTVFFENETFISAGYTDIFLFKFSSDQLNLIEQNQTSQLKIYPNPIKDFLNINISNKDINLSAEIINLLGQQIKIFQNVNNTENLDVSDLSPGIYLLNLINLNGEKQTIKIKKI